MLTCPQPHHKIAATVVPAWHFASFHIEPTTTRCAIETMSFSLGLFSIDWSVSFKLVDNSCGFREGSLSDPGASALPLHLLQFLEVMFWFLIFHLAPFGCFLLLQLIQLWGRLSGWCVCLHTRKKALESSWYSSSRCESIKKWST